VPAHCPYIATDVHDPVAVAVALDFVDDEVLLVVLVVFTEEVELVAFVDELVVLTLLELVLIDDVELRVDVLSVVEVLLLVAATPVPVAFCPAHTAGPGTV
jgi:hypothetical protein